MSPPFRDFLWIIAAVLMFMIFHNPDTITQLKDVFRKVEINPQPVRERLIYNPDNDESEH